MNPFDFVTAVSFTKEDLFAKSDNPSQTNSDYIPYMVNKALSYKMDSLMYANEMNCLYDLDHDMQFSYYLNSLRKRKRFSKWHKTEEVEDLELVCEYYQCNRQIGKQYLKILDVHQLSLLKEKLKKGGVK